MTNHFVTVQVREERIVVEERTKMRMKSASWSSRKMAKVGREEEEEKECNQSVFLIVFVLNQSRIRSSDQNVGQRSAGSSLL